MLTNEITVNLALSGHSKIDKTKVLKTDYSLMQVKSIAECSNGEHSAIQSNLDYSKCLGPQEFFRIIGSSNDQNREFLDIFRKAWMLS